MINLNYELTYYQYAILILLLLSGIMLACRHWSYRAVIRKAKEMVPTGRQEGISVVISAKNEYVEIKQNLHFWLEQNNSLYEVVVVYDKADDDLRLLLNDMKKRYNHLKLLIINDVNMFDDDRFYVSIGIKAASYSCVIVTNADCRPRSEECISYIQAAYTSVENNADIVLAYHTSSHGNNSFFKITSYFIFNSVSNYLGFALKSMPYLGSQNIIAYKKDFFLKHNGYTADYGRRTGRFDCFYKRINNKRSKAKVVVQPSLQASVKSFEKLNFIMWIKKEIQFYNAILILPIRSKQIKELTVFVLTVFMFYITIALGIFDLLVLEQWVYNDLFFYLFISIILVKYITQIVADVRLANKLKERYLWAYLPFCEILYLPLYFVFVFKKYLQR